MKWHIIKNIFISFLYPTYFAPLDATKFPYLRYFRDTLCLVCQIICSYSSPLCLLHFYAAIVHFAHWSIPCFVQLPHYIQIYIQIYIYIYNCSSQYIKASSISLYLSNVHSVNWVYLASFPSVISSLLPLQTRF